MGPSRKKLVIDTDPGIDDGMAILTAMNSEEVDIIGLTTVFGNVYTPTATRNAFKLLEIAGRTQIPVAEGAQRTFAGIEKDWVADFVHGDDGFGNMNFPDVKGKKDSRSAADFLIDLVREQPGEISVLALGPVTNLALAMQQDPSFAGNLGELVILGGAFFVNGNVNPATEANFFGDPEAADFVFGHGAKIKVVGLDVTHSCTFTGSELKGLHGKGRFGTFLSSITAFYLKYHQGVMYGITGMVTSHKVLQDLLGDSYDMDAVYVHDPAALAVVLWPSLFTWRPGQIRVLTESVARGMSVMDTQLKRWNRPHPWTDRPKVQVAVAVNAQEVTQRLLQRMGA